MGVDRSGISKIIVIPDIVQDLLPGQSDSLILQEIGQKFKFFVTQFQRLSIQSCLMSGLVDPDTSCLQYAFRICLSGTAQNCFHPCHQDFGRERFGNIFIHSQIKSQKLVPLITFCRQHNNRHLGILADLPADLPSIHLWHHHIQDDQSDFFILEKNIHRFFSVAGLQNLVAAFAQEVLDQFPHPAFIIYHQNFYLIHVSPRPLFSVTPDFIFYYSKL